MKLVNSMKKIFYITISCWVLTSCSGPSYFNSPTDYAGGNRAAAVASHCQKTGGGNKEGVAYRLCQEGFNTHYGR